MRAVRQRAIDRTATGSVAAASSEELKSRLRSLHGHCLTELADGLEAMRTGDLTVTVTPVTQPIDVAAVPEDQRALVELFNAMLTKAQGAIVSYNAVREQLAAALGDHSCIDDLQTRLTSLSDNCMTALAEGLGAAAEGDLTVEAHPVTKPLVAPGGGRLGRLGVTFNEMLGKAQAGLVGYNAMRARLGDRVGTMVEEIGALAGRVAASSQQMSASSEQVGAAMTEIARATTTVAEGAERQVGLVEGRPIRDPGCGSDGGRGAAGGAAGDGADRRDSQDR